MDKKCIGEKFGNKKVPLLLIQKDSWQESAKKQEIWGRQIKFEHRKDCKGRVNDQWLNGRKEEIWKFPKNQM